MEMIKAREILRNKVEELCEENCKYEYLRNLTMSKNNRLTRTMGRYMVDEFAIQLSGKLLALSDDETVEQVILHELAHAIVDRIEYKGQSVPDHGKEFKAVCKHIGCWHDKATNASNYTQSKDSYKNIGYKYIVKCPACDAKWYYKTKCKVVKGAAAYGCSCGHKGLVVEEL